MFMLQEEKSNQQLHSVVNPIRYKHGLARHAHWHHSGMSSPESYQALYYSKPALQDHNVEFFPDTIKEAKNSQLNRSQAPGKESATIILLDRCRTKHISKDISSYPTTIIAFLSNNKRNRKAHNWSLCREERLWNSTPQMEAVCHTHSSQGSEINEQEREERL